MADSHGKRSEILRFAQNDINQTSYEGGRRDYERTIKIALVDATGCAGREFDYVWNSFIDRTKSATTRNAFLHAALLGNYWRLNCARNLARVLAAVAQMDAAHVADF